MAKRKPRLHPDDRVEVISVPDHPRLKKFLGEQVRVFGDLSHGHLLNRFT